MTGHRWRRGPKQCITQFGLLSQSTFTRGCKGALKPRELGYCANLPSHVERMFSLGPFFGLIHVIIMAVSFLFFMALERMYPREQIHCVEDDWDQEKFREVAPYDGRPAT